MAINLRRLHVGRYTGEPIGANPPSQRLAPIRSKYVSLRLKAYSARNVDFPLAVTAEGITRE